MSALPSKWADSPSEESGSQLKSSIVTPKKGDPLPSKWSTPVTSEKGKPLASRWAEAKDEGSSTSSVSQGNHLHESENRKGGRGGGKKGSRHHHKHHQRRSPREEQDDDDDDDGDDDNEKGTGDSPVAASPAAKEFSSRLGLLSLDDKKKESRKSPSKKKKAEIQHQDNEDQWEDDEEVKDQITDKYVDDRVTPSPGAKDFAARLGISLDGKDSPVSKEHTTTKPNGPHSSKTKGKIQLQKDRTSTKKNTKKKSVKVVAHDEESEPVLTEEDKKRIEKRDQLVEAMVNGAKFDWAADDDDDFF